MKGRKSSSSLIVFALIVSMLVWMMPPLTFADAPKYEKVLKIVSGSQSNLGTFTYALIVGVLLSSLMSPPASAESPWR